MQTNPTLKTRQQIAEELGIDRKTLYNKIKQANIQISNGLLTLQEQQLIYQFFGKTPPKWEEDKKEET